MLGVVDPIYHGVLPVTLSAIRAELTQAFISKLTSVPSRLLVLRCRPYVEWLWLICLSPAAKPLEHSDAIFDVRLGWDLD